MRVALFYSYRSKSQIKSLFRVRVGVKIGTRSVAFLLTMLYMKVVICYHRHFVLKTILEVPGLEPMTLLTQVTWPRNLGATLILPKQEDPYVLIGQVSTCVYFSIFML